MNVFLTILCSIFLIAAMFTGIKSFTFLNGASVIEGTIAGVDRSVEVSGGETSQRSYPIIRYSLRGNDRTFKAKIAALNCEVGEKAYVAYREDGKAKLISLGEIFMLPAILGLFGVVLFLLLFPLSKSSHIAYTLFNMFNLFQN